MDLSRSCLVLLAVLLGCAAVRAEGGEDAAAVAIVRWQTGPLLLRDGRWAEAARAFAGLDGYLDEVVANLLYEQRFGGELLREPRQRREVLAFYFWQRDLANAVGAGGGPRLCDWLREYRDLAVTPPALSPPLPPLDASHLDLLERMLPEMTARRDLRPYGREALALLTAGSEALPVLVAYLCYLEAGGAYASERWEPDTLAKHEWPAAEQMPRLAPLVRRSLACACALHWSSVPSVPAQGLLEAGWQDGCSEEERARLLLALAKLDSEKRPLAARKSAEGVLRLFPRARAAEEALVLAMRLALAGGAARGAAYLRELRLQAPGAPGLDQAEFDVAAAWFAQGDYAQAETLLLGLRARCSGKALESRALLGLSEICAKTGRPEEERRYLEACVQCRQSQWTDRSIMDAASTTSVAGQRLALWHEQRQQWPEALAAWQAWRPESWCGTCAESMHVRRLQSVARCAQRLGRQSVATEALWEAAARWDSARAALQLVSLYRQAGQLADLRACTDRLGVLTAENYRRRRESEELISLLQRGRERETLWAATHLPPWRDAGETAPLIAAAAGDDRYPTDTISVGGYCGAGVAAELLGSLGGLAVPATLAAIQEHRGRVSWLIYSLGCNSSAEALEALVTVAGLAGTHRDDYGNLLYALSRHGAAGTAAIARLAAGSGELSQRAKYWPDERLKLPAPPDEVPQPVPGSLPAELACDWLDDQ